MRKGIITAALGAFALSLLLVAALTGAAPAGATTTGDYEAQIAALKVQTQNATFTSQNAASAALSAGKTADAIQKLTDFQTTLNALATAPKAKIDQMVAQNLAAQTQEVIVCINSVGTP